MEFWKREPQAARLLQKNAKKQGEAKRKKKLKKRSVSQREGKTLASGGATAAGQLLQKRRGTRFIGGKRAESNRGD